METLLNFVTTTGRSAAVLDAMQNVSWLAGRDALPGVGDRAWSYDMTTPSEHPYVIKFRDDRSSLEAYEQIDRNDGETIADTLTIEIRRRKLGL